MPRFPTYIQDDAMDCGPSCLKIVAQYYGKDFSLNYLRRLCNTNILGTSFLGISKAAETIGFRTIAVKINFERLKSSAPLPVIIHWEQNHFVILYKIDHRKVYVSDPGCGLLVYTHKEFIRKWIGKDSNKEAIEGIALLFEVTPFFYENSNTGDNQGKRDGLKIATFLRHYLLPYKRLMGQVLLGLLAGSFLTLLFPILTQSIIDVGINQKDIDFIWLILIGQLAITFGQLSLEVIRSWTLLHISKRMSISLLSDFFVKLMKLPIRFFDTKLTGDLMQRIGDHSRIQSFLTNTTLTTIFSVFNSLLYGGILIYYSVPLFLIFVIGSIFYLLWIAVFLKKRKRLDYQRFHQSAETNSKIFELINGMQELKLHNAEQQKRWEWERIQVRQYKISISSLSLEQMQGIGSRIISEVKNIFITVVSAKLVIDGKITLGMMLSISYIIGQLNGPVLQLVDIVRAWQDAKISLNRLAEIYLKGDEVSLVEDELVNSQLAIPQDHTIKITNLSFRYDELSEFVLSNINLNIQAKKVTAIVGTSGSGKTTLLKLLMRYYDPTGGVITVGNDVDLAKVDIYKWRRSCGVVMQEGFIFNDTISGNIAVGEDMPDIIKLRQAIELANIKGFIESLPRGLNTKIGPEGLGISTGQKQRILIARAIYKNPDIIFFDEATSSLDANNEKEIMENLRSFYHGKTVVVIAHRLSTVIDADNIIVLEKGEIAESGNHFKLIEEKGLYYNLVKNQLQLSA